METPICKYVNGHECKGEIPISISISIPWNGDLIHGIHSIPFHSLFCKMVNMYMGLMLILGDGDGWQFS